MHYDRKSVLSKFRTTRFFLMVATAAIMLVTGMLAVLWKHGGLGLALVVLSLTTIVVFSHPRFLEKR